MYDRFVYKFTSIVAGWLDYEIVDDKKQVYKFYHIEVDSKFRGQGLAPQLAKFAFDFAKEKGWKLQVTCSYLASKFLPQTKGEYDSCLLK